MSCFHWPQSGPPLLASEHRQTFFSLTTVPEAMSQRKVVTTVWWAPGCVQSGSERQMAIMVPLCQNKLLRAPGGVHSSGTFSAISLLLSQFDKLWPLRNNTLHRLSEGRLSHIQAAQTSTLTDTECMRELQCLPTGLQVLLTRYSTFTNKYLLSSVIMLALNIIELWGGLRCMYTLMADIYRSICQLTC